MPSTEGKRRRPAIRLARGTGATLSGLAAAIVVALGVPLVWIWLASQLAGTKRELTPSLAILITTGILVSYWLVLLLGSFLRRHWVGEAKEQAQHRRMSWNRSFRDEPLRMEDQHSDPIERIFIIVAVIAVIAFEIWFFFFAGSPLPSQPAF
jgi:hypothetical protein